MSDSSPVTVRLPNAVKAKLERLAKDTKRSRNFLAAEAIADYVEVNEWQIEGIKRSIKELDEGRGVPHGKVKAWADSLGTPDEKPVPESGS